MRDNAHPDLKRAVWQNPSAAYAKKRAYAPKILIEDIRS